MLKKKLITPFQKFINIEGAGGILLFIATIVALIWANSPFGHFYESMWDYKLGLQTDSFSLVKPAILWVNDGLMAIFFFVIGLEIKRELSFGELNTMRKAALPMFAALGGLLIPVFLYFMLNKDPSTEVGWGIPMATDIAFSLAILKLLGDRVPMSLKIFLTAFAIIDDIGAVLAIAIFYTSGIHFDLLLFALVPFAILIYFSWKGIYIKQLVLLLGLIIWLLFLKSGIHPTLAGILVAFTIPIRQKVDIPSSLDKLRSILNNIINAPSDKDPILTKSQMEQIDDLEDWTESVQSPLQHLEHKLHNWVAYFILPVFAFANTGIIFSSEMQLEWPLAINIALALILGKSVGISLLSWLGIKTGLATLPESVKFQHIIGIGFIAGIGFTMSIFIAMLAFSNQPDFVDSAKVGILIGSLISGLAGYLLLRLTVDG